MKSLLNIYTMSKKNYNTYGKIIGIFLLSLIISLPVPAIASHKRLVLFPLAIYADQSKAYLGQGIKRMLISRISGAGIEIVPDEKYTSLLSEKEVEGITSQKRAEELARILKADYVIFGSITAIGGGYSLDLSLLELEKDGSKLTRLSKAVDEDQLIPQLSDVAYKLRAFIQGKQIPATQTAGKSAKKLAGGPGREIAEKAAVLPKPRTAKGIFSQIEGDKQGPKAIEKGLLFKPTREYQGFKPTGKISVGMSVMAFDMGDLDAKAGVELLVLGRKKLLLYARQGASFVLKDTLKAGFGEDFLKVSAGDTDNDGMAEIYLVSRYGIRARSTVLQWDGKFKRLDRRAGHMQAVKDPISGKALLLFKNSKVDEFFSGRIYIMNYGEGGKLTKGEKLPELEGVQFYTLALFDTDKDGDPEWIGLGDESRLYVWDKQGEVLWRGDRHLGGTNNAIALGDAEPGDPPPRIAFNARLLIADIDGDGKREILAIKNIPLIKHVVNFKVYTKSLLIVYRIEEGQRLSPAWTTGDIDWCLTDMQAQGQTLFLAVQKGKVSNIGKRFSQIMWFE
ncbi:MAG: hypothetical protein JRI72_09510 [Deltaproteobacteria bacterium]|nr:hypothetical protein [Deltaproteobacteria bacterium]